VGYDKALMWGGLDRFWRTIERKFVWCQDVDLIISVVLLCVPLK